MNPLRTLPWTALTPKITVETSTSLMRPAVSAVWAASKPGAITVETSQGASAKAMAARPLTTRTTRLVTAEAKRHAPCRSSSVRKPANTGMKAVASAPPATMVNRRSGSLKAA